MQRRPCCLKEGIAAGLAVALMAMVSTCSPLCAEPRLQSASGGTVRAFLVGIDRYDNVNNLKGSVNDTEDLRAALARVGVTDVRVLENAQATRAAFLAAMDTLLRDSRSGDLAVIAYSGHGATVPEYPQFKGLEADGFTEEYIMVDYEPTGPGSGAIIANKEMKAWLARFDQKQVDVLMISDSCFGGGMIRGPLDPRAPEPSLRFLRNAAAPRGQSRFSPMPMSPEELKVDVSTLPHVTFLAGADSLTPVPEVFIPASPTFRGALSYVMARAIEGKALGKAKEATTRGALFQYARQRIQVLSDDQRIASFPNPTEKDRSVLDRPVYRLVDTTPPAEPGVTDDCTVKVAVVGGGGVPAAELGTPHAHYAIVADRRLSDIVWDPGALQVIQASGDIIESQVPPGGLGGVIDRTAAIACVKKISDPRPQDVTLLGGVKRYTPGDIPDIKVTGIGGRNLVALNIASNGYVQLIFAATAAQLQSNEDVWTYTPDVVPPFGADYLVVVTSAVPLTAFERWIRDHDNRPPPPAGLLDEQLQIALASDPTLRIGAVALYTSEK